jgi:uncharacterized protein YfkK (UPF0435 family)
MLQTLMQITEPLYGRDEMSRVLFEQLPVEETVVFSSPQFLVALVAGVMMAFGFQLLLTNLSIAFAASPGTPSNPSDNSDDVGDTIRGIETKIGLWTTITVSLALFAACFLAVKLSLVGSALLGAIVGVVIWATFFSLLVWLGSTAVGSLVGSLVSTAASGLKGMMGTATAVVGANVAKGQAISTAEDIAATVRRELTSGIDPDSIRNTLQSSLSGLQLPKLDLDEIRGQFEKLLKDSNLKNIADSDLLQNLDRQTFVDLVSSRSNFSKQDVNQVADQLEKVWRQTVGQGNPQAQIADLLKSVKSEDLNSEELTGKLQQMVKSGVGKQVFGSNPAGQAVELGVSLLLSQALKNVKLSDLDVGKLSGQLQKLKSAVGDQAKATTSGEATKPFSVIQADLENYLLFSKPWELNRESVRQEFRDVIYDPQADPSAIRQELELVDRNYFVNLLSLREDFTPEGVQALVGYLEEIRAEVFSTVQAAETQGRSADLRSRVENYLRSTGKAELNPNAIGRDFKTLLQDPEAGLDALGDRLGQFDRDTLVKLLQQRQDISPEEANQIVEQLEGARDRVLSEAKELQDRVQLEVQALRQKVEDYLRNTNKEELNPDGIKRDLQTLFEDPKAGLGALRSRLSQFDRETLVQLLSQRQDLSEEQVNQVLDQVESVRDSILQAPQKLAGQAKEQYDQTVSALEAYLRKTDLEELNPDGIKRDLQTLLEDPKTGAAALRSRMSQVDRETLVKLLSQRDDLSEEQVNQAIDQLQSSIREIVQSPRRLAKRVQKQAVDFEGSLENYLRNTSKEELNPDGIKRDLQTLLSDPQVGLASLGDRLSQFDRSTFVALLSQREDTSEEEANRIADQVESAFSNVVEQIQKVRQTAQSAIDSVIGKVRNYLDSLERPELSYDGIKQDFSKLFDDPQAGFEALSGRLGEFDRDTLVAVLSSREDISEADANRIIDQIEGVRDSVLQRAERIQQETQKRLRAIQQDVKKRAVETQKVAAGAAWWLFGTALTSLVASAIAGVIAASGSNFF